MITGSKDERQYLGDVRGIRKALERIADALEGNTADEPDRASEGLPGPSGEALEAWCEPDGCPAAICGGPHVDHECEAGTVTTHVDNPAPCPFCGKVPA